jgi:hypothetical protein
LIERMNSGLDRLVTALARRMGPGMSALLAAIRRGAATNDHAIRAQKMAAAELRVAAAVGPDNVSREMGYEANASMALLMGIPANQFNPPWDALIEVGGVASSPASLNNAFPNVVFFTTDPNDLSNAWGMPISEVTKADGTTLQPLAQIASEFSLPPLKEGQNYYMVSGIIIPEGANIMFGIAGAIAGWGAGGGLQIFIRNGKLVGITSTFLGRP